MANATSVIIAILLCLGLQAQEDFESRIASVEETLDRYYRGERLESAVERSTRGIEAYNARAKKLQAEIERERILLEQVMARGKEDRLRLEEMDKELKNLPSGTFQDVIKRKVDARNDLVRKVNDQSANNRRSADDYNALVARIQEEIEAERKRVLAVQDAVNARMASFETFTKAGQDALFFVQLNRLLAEVRQAQRTKPDDPMLAAAITKIRAFRRELAAWAEAGQALRPNGLVIVKALVGDEPCWFVVDTGAMDTILSSEIVDAVGYGGNLGKETSFSVVGGLRVTGLAFCIPRLEVGGQVVKDVRAFAVLPSDVGIDGLLGQSFLKSFAYFIDERKPEKLFLTPR